MTRPVAASWCFHELCSSYTFKIVALSLARGIMSNLSEAYWWMGRWLLLFAMPSGLPMPAVAEQEYVVDCRPPLRNGVLYHRVTR